MESSQKHLIPVLILDMSGSVFNIPQLAAQISSH